MKKFLIIAGMIMCFVLGGCSVGIVDAKESSSNTSNASSFNDEYILKYADTGRDFTAMDELIDKETGVHYFLIHSQYGIAITPRMDDWQSNGLYHER